MKTILMSLLLLSNSAQAALSAFPSFVNFYNVRLDGFGQSQTVSVQNTGRQEVRLSTSNTCYGDFQVNNWCSFSLPPGGSCSIEIRFAPRREGYQSCNIWISDNEGGSASINVSGQGTP